MTHISLFNDFMNTTEGALISGPEEVLAEVVKRSYTHALINEGKDKDEYLQGGDTIFDFIQLDDQDSARFYDPDDEETVTQAQTLTKIEFGWTFFRDRAAWNDETTKLNNLGRFKRSYRYRTLKKLRKQIERAVMISMCNKMERQVWKKPDANRMDGVTQQKEATCIPYMVNEFAGTVSGSSGGLWNNSDGAGTPSVAAEAVATSIQGVSGVTKPLWSCQNATYSGNPSTTANWYTVMGKVFRKVQLARLPKDPDLSEKVTMPTKVMTGDNGMAYVEDLYRSSNDRFARNDNSDPTVSPLKFRGVEFCYVEELNTAELYVLTGAPNTFVREGLADNAGPRFYVLNFAYLMHYFHTERYFYRHPVRTPSRQPSSHVQYYDTWYNLGARSLLRQALVSPSASISDYTALI